MHLSYSSYDIPDQAFLRFERGSNPVFSFGAVGIVGLGFTGLSHINTAVANSGDSWGQSLLYNIFKLEPNLPNYIAFALDRTTGPADGVEGSFGLGEVDDKYAAVQNTDHIPLYPPTGTTRWTVLLDSFASDGVNHELTSTVAGVPKGRAVVLLDTGTTYSYADPSVAQAIYGNIQGARLDNTRGQWIVPCTAGIYLTLWIA
jgi:saccharopepsin